MTNNKPLVSIGIPYFNAQSYIIETLESVKGQTYDNIELILVNDCSTDESQRLVSKWLEHNRDYFSNVIEFVNSENRGVAYSSRLLQNASSGIFFTKLDADDIILPDKITEQTKYLIANPEVALVYSNTLLIESSGNLLSEDYFKKQNFSTVTNCIGPSGSIFKELLIEDFIPASSVLVRKEVIDAVGGYDESLRIEDWDMWLRIAKSHHIHFMDGYFSKYRLHPESMMHKKESLIKVYKSLIIALLKHRNITPEFDTIIAKHLYTYTIGMYRFGVIDKHFLKLNLKYSKNLKSLFYFLMGNLYIRVHQKA